MAPPKKSSAAESIMPPEKMRPMLAASKQEPVQAAIGLTTDGEGVILLDKKMKPRKVLAQLRAMAGKAQVQLQPSSLRFGRAEVDPEYDATMLRFFVNKEAPGNMRPKLVEVVKRISFGKVEINVDPSLDQEDEEGAEDQPAAAAAAAPPPPAPPAPPPPITAEPPPDADAIKRALSGLVGRIAAAAGADGERKALLLKLATDANLKLKTNNFNAAQELVRQLGEALGDAGTGSSASEPAPAAPEAPAPSPAQNGSGAVNYGKCRLLWIGTRRKVESDIDNLVGEIRKAFADEGTGDALGALFKDRVKPIMTGFDESLVDKLDEAINQTDPAKHAALVAEAREIVDRYRSFLDTEPLIGKLDKNTLAPIAIAKTMGAALQALSASIR